MTILYGMCLNDWQIFISGHTHTKRGIVSEFLSNKEDAYTTLPKIVDGLFLLCSGHCLEYPSFDVFFNSDQTKPYTFLVVSLL